MGKTHVRASRELRNNFPEIARLVENHDQVIITRNGNGTAVLINFDDYAAYEDYLHKQYVMSELKKAQEEAGDPNTEWLSDESFWTGIEACSDELHS